MIFQVYTENPCEKLKTLGDDIQTKAVLSSLIIKGKAGMKMDLPNANYKLTINCTQIIKGSLGKWKKQILIAGEFSSFKDEKDVCQFQSDDKLEKFYFLQAISENNGEYRVLFNPESINDKNMDQINKIICKKCGKPPTITMTEVKNSNEVLVVDCESDGLPPPIVKWDLSKPNEKSKQIQIKNGVQLIQPLSNSTNEKYICSSINVFGNSTYSIMYKSTLFKSPNLISHCSFLDKTLCGGNGKCYEDNTNKKIQFCRCDEGFEGPNCSPIIRNVPENSVQRFPTMDSSFCNNQGNAYKDLKTKSMCCFCKNKEAGKNCEQKMKGRAADYDESNLRKFVEEQNSKLAIKYIIIGCLIVLGGCIIVIIVIISVWKFYIARCNKKKNVYAGEQENEDQNYAMNNMNNRNNNNNNQNTIKIQNSNSTNNVENSLLITHIEPNNSVLLSRVTNVSGNGIYDNNF